MSLVRLTIKGISYSQTQNGAYALLLSEIEGQRQLPIVIGAFEAQSIAIAFRFNAPIFTYQNILEKAGIYLKTEDKEKEDDPLQETELMINKEFDEESANPEPSSKSNLPKKSIQELEKELEKAVNKEDYEEAARLRDEISKRK